MSGDVERLERELRERLRRADLPSAPGRLHAALDEMVRAPVEPPKRPDRKRVIRLLAIAAVLVVGSVLALVVGGGLPRTAIKPVPSPTPSVSTPTRSPPNDASTEVEWRSLATMPPSAVGGTAHIVGFEGGYVVTDGSSTVQVSSDGRSWAPITLPLDAGVFAGVRSIAADGGRVVMAGGYSPCPGWSWEDATPARGCRMRPVSWASTDGHTWEQSVSWEEAIAPVDWYGSMFTAMWAVPGGGWDAAQSFWTSNEGDGFGPAVFHSNDGRRWSLLQALPATEPLPGSVCSPYWVAEHLRVLADPAGRRIAREGSECDEGAISMSADGRTYERLDGLAATAFWDGLAPIGSEPWVLVGDRPDPGAQPTAWVSTDLRDWRSIDLPVPANGLAYWVSSIERTATGLVVTGRTDLATGENRLITWLGNDGQPWRIADERADPGSGIEDIASGPGGVLGVSVAPVSDETVSIQVVRLEER